MGTIIFDRDELDLIVSLAGCTLNKSPGKNWVEGAGGLPEYICRIARAIHRTGKTVSQAIAIAVSRVKKWAAGADDVDADTRAKAAKALAQWEALKVKNKAKTAAKKVAGKASGAGADRDTVRASSVAGHEILCLAKTDFNVDKVKAAFDNHTRSARNAWRAANPSSNYEDGPPYFYVREQWTNYLIVSTDGYRSDGRLFKVGYTVDAKQNVTFEEPVEVTTKYVVVQSSDVDDTGISDADLQKVLAMSAPGDTADLDTILRFVGKPARPIQPA